MCNMIRDILITPVLNGFICKVGCQRVVFESVVTLVQNLEAYLKDPNGTEARFIRDAVNKDQPQPLTSESVQAQPMNPIDPMSESRRPATGRGLV